MSENKIVQISIDQIPLPKPQLIDAILNNRIIGECELCKKEVYRKKSYIKSNGIRVSSHWCHYPNSICKNKPSCESENHKLAKKLLTDYLNNKNVVIFISKCDSCNIHIENKIPENVNFYEQEKSDDKSRRWDIAGFHDENKIIYGIEIFNTHKAETENRKDILWFEVDSLDVIDKLFEYMPENLTLNDIRKYSCTKCVLEKEKEIALETERKIQKEKYDKEQSEKEKYDKLIKEQRDKEYNEEKRKREEQRNKEYNEEKRKREELEKLYNDLEIKSIYDVAIKCPPEGWRKQFKDCDNELKQVSMLIHRDEQSKNYISVPPIIDIFSTFHCVPLDKVRVVIIGQDPYINVGQAMGKSFSVRKGIDIPPSLKNIYKEISSCISDFKTPNHGDVSKWEKSGVLLLNISLTTMPNESNAHGKYKIWMPFIKKILEAITEKRPNCIYLLWGNFAQSMEKYIGEKSIKFVSGHPSPMNVAHGGSWFGNYHFYKVNQELIKMGETPVDWNVD